MQAGQPITFNGSAGTHKIVDLETIETTDAALTIGGQSLNLNAGGSQAFSIDSSRYATFSGPKLTINGDVDIQGTLNSISSTQVTFDDSTILLNSNKPSDEAAANGDPDAGFEVNRGANTNVSFLWNETNDNWLLTGGPLNMGSLKITSLATPTAATDAATMGYVDDANAAMTTFVTDSIATANSAMTTYVDGKFGSVDLSDLLRIDGTVAMTGSLNMGGSQNITGLATPTADDHAATMKYVDDANTAMTTFVTDSIATANSAMTTFVTDSIATANSAMTTYVDNAVSGATITGLERTEEDGNAVWTFS